jgi:hypothetical protein
MVDVVASTAETWTDRYVPDVKPEYIPAAIASLQSERRLGRIAHRIKPAHVQTG